MANKQHNRFLLTLLCAMVLLAATAQKATITAKLDSTLLLMGHTTALHLQVVQNASSQGVLPVERQDTLNAAVEIAEKMRPDTIDLGNGRIQISRDLILQSFDSGLYALPPILYVVDGETIQSKSLALKVVPVKVDTTQDIVGLKEIEVVPFNLLDWLPDFITDYWWCWLLLLIICAAALYYYHRWYKKGKNPLRPEKKRLPPYEEAMLNLEALKNRQLWQNGQEKEYFTGLTDILRVYIDRRFAVNAVEMTSTQIVETLKQNGETKAVNEQLSMILEMADIVKFAAVRPLADDNELAYRRAVNFVEQTRPTDPSQEKEEEKR